MIDANRFREMTGREPENDDLDRCNCQKAGTVGHLCCGVCEHNLPVFECPECTKRIEDFYREGRNETQQRRNDTVLPYTSSEKELKQIPGHSQLVRGFFLPAYESVRTTVRNYSIKIRKAWSNGEDPSEYRKAE
jgi:hypothetical protein